MNHDEDDTEAGRPYLHTQPGFPSAPVADPRLDDGRGKRLLLHLLLTCSALAAGATAAAAGWIWHRDRQVIARHALPAGEAAHTGAAAIDALLGDDCPPLPDALRKDITANGTLIHHESAGDWGSGHQELRIYRHHYLDYYAEYSTGFFPVQRSLCRVG